MPELSYQFTLFALTSTPRPISTHLKTHTGLTATRQAFSATRPVYTSRYPNQTISGDVGDLTFSSVLLDNAQAYDVNTGVLTVKESGRHLLSLTLSLNMVLTASINGGLKVSHTAMIV